MKPSASDIKAMLRMHSPDHSDAGQEVLASKLSFMTREQPKPYVHRKANKGGKRAKNKRPEDILQITCCKLLATLPETLYFSIPNHLAYRGSNYSHGAIMALQNRQRAMGLMAGCADLAIIFRSYAGAISVCLPELKSEVGSLSDNQAAFANRADRVGCHTGVVRSLDDLIAMLKKAGHVAFRSA